MHAEYRSEVNKERVKAGIDAARKRGVPLGRPPANPEIAARMVRDVDRLVAEEGCTVEKAAKTLGWSRSTYYRHASAMSANRILDEPDDVS